MAYNLKRTRDNAGDSGSVSMIFRIDPETDLVEYQHDKKPKVGWAIIVGTNLARSYTSQDWWRTTLVTEILEESENEVKFKTSNSEYTWKVT